MSGTLRAVLKDILGANETVEDIDLGAVDALPPLIPDGAYEVGFVRAVKPFSVFKEQRVLLYFKIVTPGEHAGKELFMAMRVSPRNGRKSMAASSKMAQMCAVAAGRSTVRHDRLSTKVFAGKYFMANVYTVKTNWRKRLHPEVCRYSAIDILTEQTAGGSL